MNWIKQQLVYLYKRPIQEQNSLMELYDEFNKWNIEHFVIGGGLIGSQRNKKLIEHDDDLDVVIFDKDIQKIIEKKNILNNKYIIEEIFFGFALTFKCNNNIRLDICVISKFNDTYNYKSYDFRKMFPNEYVYEEEIYPIQYSLLMNRTIPVFNKTTDYLNRSYPKWNTIFYIHPPHYLSNSIKKYGIWFNSVTLRVIGFIIGLKYWKFDINSN